MRHILPQVVGAGLGPVRRSVGREGSLMSDIPGNDEAGARPVANVAEVVQIKVNGMVIKVAETIMVREILTQAKWAGAIEGMIEEYILEKVEEEGELGVLGIDETIVVTERDEFLAVPTGRTEVA